MPPRIPRIPGVETTLVNRDTTLSGNSTKADVAAVTGLFGSPLFAAPATRQPPIKAGVYGCGGGNGVQGDSSSASDSGVWGNNGAGGKGVAGTSDQPGGVGVFARGADLAGQFVGNSRFEGNVEITGLLHLTNADCAEDFDIAGGATVDPGTVMVLGDEGVISPSRRAYDTRVAGVISDAGIYRAGIVLDRTRSTQTRQPVALMGKVFCKVDASYGAVSVGDPLTTSATEGHAMRASSPEQAFGAVIGKALRPLREGQALIPILVSLQ